MTEQFKYSDNETIQGEANRYFEGMEAVQLPAHSLKTPLFLPSFAEMLTSILVSHGITVEIKTGYVLLIFPDRSYKKELLPRTHDEKYKIVLPDGFELLEVRRRFQEFSYLQIDPAQLSLDQQTALKSSKREKKTE